MKFFEFLEDPNGKLSGLRIAILVWIITICFNVTYLSIVSQKFVGPEASMITGLGMLMGGKVVQNFSESKSLEKSKPQP
jgi:hypothetical protein